MNEGSGDGGHQTVRVLGRRHELRNIAACARASSIRRGSARTLYKDRKDEDGRCVSPINLALGIVGDFWTPRAAQPALWVVTQMTPRKSAELFERIGRMTPSKSSLGRLPKVLAERWESNHEAFEAAFAMAW